MDVHERIALCFRHMVLHTQDDLAALKAASEKTAGFRRDMPTRVGGMLERIDVAKTLGIGPVEVSALHNRRQILGVPYGAETRYLAAQFVNGRPLHGLNDILHAFDDMNPWEQLMLLATPLEGFSEHPETILQMLAKEQDSNCLQQLTGLALSWAT